MLLLMTQLNCLRTIYLFIFGDNILSILKEAVRSINALNSWFIRNKLRLNLSKTCYMTFLLILHASHCNLIVNGQSIEKFI